MYHYTKLQDIALKNQRVLVREDFNVPMENGQITSDARLRAALPTLRYLLTQQARILILSHLGRPKEGEPDPNLSLAPIAQHLSTLLNQPVHFFTDWRQAKLGPGEIGLAENVRFNRGEKTNDPTLAKAMGEACDVFVMDAFACAHRAEVTTEGLAHFAPQACAGFLLQQEVDALQKAFAKPQHPFVAIVGGAKVSTKLQVLRQLLQRVDCLIVGGGIANTFLLAQGFSIGASLVETELLGEARALMELATQNGKPIPLPLDVVVAKTFSAQAIGIIKPVDALAADDLILDIGPKTRTLYRELLLQAGTIVWNGPLGVFEFSAFAAGTQALAQAVAESAAFSIAGGGDTIAALEHFGLLNKMSYVSTAGGAFIEFIEGKSLPGLTALTRASQPNQEEHEPWNS